MCGKAPLCGIETPAAPPPGLLGTGLGPAALLAVLAVVTALFLVWDGPLWTAPRGTSHLGRIGLSYLCAVPLIELALRHAQVRTTQRAINATLVVWAAKLIVTSTLFALLADGGERYSPARPWERRPQSSAVHSR